MSSTDEEKKLYFRIDAKPNEVCDTYLTDDEAKATPGDWISANEAFAIIRNAKTQEARAEPLQTDKRNPGQIAAEAFYADNRHLSSVAYNCDTSASWDRVAAAVLEHCTPVITTEQHAALLRRIADQKRALDEARGNLAILARMLADAVGRERG